jgi:hypothetical protein
MIQSPYQPATRPAQEQEQASEMPDQEASRQTAGRGEVQAKVTEYFAERPGQELNCHDVAGDLQLNHDSVNNVCARLAKRGIMQRVRASTYVWTGRHGRGYARQPRPADSLTIGTYLEVVGHTSSGNSVARCEKGYAWKLVRI